jgi:hypothetical protein
VKVLFRLTDEELESILNASKPVPYMIIGGHVPASPQENANAAWEIVAAKHGFVWDTAESANTGDQHDVLAERIKPVEPLVEAVDEIKMKGQQ